MAKKPPLKDEKPIDLAKDLSARNHLTSNNLMSIMSTGALIKWGLIVTAPILIFLAFLLWLSSGFNTISQSIFGAQDSISTSMEPYELTFRSVNKLGRGLPTDDSKPFEWKLTLPRAFVVTEIGPRTAIFGRSGDHDLYSVSLALVEDFKPSILKPAATADKSEFPEHFIRVNIENSGTYSEITDEDLCLHADDFWKLFDLHSGNSVLHPKECHINNVNCQIYTHYHGWGVMLQTPRKSLLYAQPQRTCDLVRVFLDKNTVSVNDLDIQK